MADAWIPLLAGSTLVVIGFLAAQLFDRFRLPDYVVLMGIGMVLGSGVLPLGAWNPEPLLLGFREVLVSVAVAFILFEGGLALHLRGLGRTWALSALHTGIAMALCVTGTWAAGTYLLGFSSQTALIVALAMCAPSAAIVLSMLPRLRVLEKTRFLLTLEGVLGNIVAAALILTIVRFPGGLPAGDALLNLILYAATTFLLAAVVGLAWDRVVGAARPRSFTFMTSVAIALLLYSVGEGFLGGNGGIAAFAFGLVLGRWGPPSVWGEVPPTRDSSRGLQEFHRELVFLLRTFFFVYLGLLIDLSRINAMSLFGALVLTAIFVASRWPSTALVARVWKLPRSDIRVLRATVARGLTDVILVLYAITVGVIPLGVIPLAEAGAVADLMFVVLTSAAFLSGGLVLVAERSGAPSMPAQPPTTPSTSAKLPAPISTAVPSPPPAFPFPPPPPPDDDPPTSAPPKR